MKGSSTFSMESDGTIRFAVKRVLYNTVFFAMMSEPEIKSWLEDNPTGWVVTL